jgi:hypothetical protein
MYTTSYSDLIRLAISFVFRRAGLEFKVDPELPFGATDFITDPKSSATLKRPLESEFPPR